MDQVGLDREVLVDEVRPVGVVGVDAADLGGGDDHHVWSVLAKPAKGRPLVGEVQLVTCRGEDLGRVAALLEASGRSRTRPSRGGRRRRHVLSSSCRPLFLVERDVEAPLPEYSDPLGLVEVVADHLVDHLVQRRGRDPAEFFFREARVTEQGLDLRGPEVARVDPDDHVTDVHVLGRLTLDGPHGPGLGLVLP